MAIVNYIIKIIEPQREYLKTFAGIDLEQCKRDAQQYLWNCPENTQYIYVATRLYDE